MAVRSATVGRDRPRSTCDRKPTERPMRSASSFRVTFLCLRRSWIRMARAASSSCLSMSDVVTQSVPGLADGLQRRGQALAEGKFRITQLLIQGQLIRIAEDRLAHRPRGGQRRQHAMAGVALQPVTAMLATDVRGARAGDVDMPAPGE